MKFDFEKTAAAHPRAEAARKLYSTPGVGEVAAKVGKAASGRRHGGVAYKDGGQADGSASKARGDKPGRYADGGAVKGEPRTKINIVVAAGKQDDDKGKEALAALLGGAAGGPPAPPTPPAPPMDAQMPGAPNGMPPGIPGLGLKHGGRATGPDMEGGAGGGLGRLEKAKDQKRAAKTKIGKNL